MKTKKQAKASKQLPTRESCTKVPMFCQATPGTRLRCSSRSPLSKASCAQVLRAQPQANGAALLVDAVAVQRKATAVARPTVARPRRRHFLTSPRARAFAARRALSSLRNAPTAASSPMRTNSSTDIGLCRADTCSRIACRTTSDCILAGPGRRRAWRPDAVAHKSAKFDLS